MLLQTKYQLADFTDILIFGGVVEVIVKIRKRGVVALQRVEYQAAIAVFADPIRVPLTAAMLSTFSNPHLLEVCTVIHLVQRDGVGHTKKVAISRCMCLQRIRLNHSCNCHQSIT